MNIFKREKLKVGKPNPNLFRPGQDELPVSDLLDLPGFIADVIDKSAGYFKLSEAANAEGDIENEKIDLIVAITLKEIAAALNDNYRQI